MSADMELDETALAAAREAIRKCDIREDHVVVAIRAYRAAEIAKAKERHAEIMAIIDNPQPPNEALRALMRDYGPKAAESPLPAQPALYQALNEMLTNGRWTEGEQRGEWAVPKEVYEMAQEARDGSPPSPVPVTGGRDDD